MRLIAIAPTESNEEESCFSCALSKENLGVYALADGSAGYSNPRAAAEIAAQSAVRLVEREQKMLRGDDSEQAYFVDLKVAELALQVANAELHRTARAVADLSGIGASATLLVLFENKAMVSHVGNTALFLIRNDCFHKLSRDHVGQGFSDKDKSEFYDDDCEISSDTSTSSQLVRSLGPHASVDVDTVRFDLLPGDIFFLASPELLKADPELEKLRETLMMGFSDENQFQQRIEQFHRLLGENGTDISSSFMAIWAKGELDNIRETERHAAEFRLKLETLSNMVFFANLSLEELIRVVEITALLHCNTGDVLIQEGTYNKKLFVNLDGLLNLSRHGNSIGKLGPGEHVGEMAMLSSAPRSATVQASIPTRVLVIEPELFKDLIQRDPQLGAKLLWNLAQELAKRLEQTNINAFGPTEANESVQ